MPKKIKHLQRKKSVITGKKNLEHLVTLPHYPVFIACTNEAETQDLFSDMSFSICKDTGVIQLDELIPPEILYSQYHSEALGALWTEHHERFVEFFSKFSPKNILEIGGSNASIAEQYLKREPKAHWTIIEPNPTKSNHPRIKVISEFFDSTTRIKGKKDAVIHSHTLEHMYDPGAFLKSIYNLLEDGALHIFSVPNLYQYLKRGYSNCINFEHSIFLTEYFINYLLAKNGFEVLKKHYFYEHSIFYATRKTDKALKYKEPSKYRENKKMFLDYIKDNNAVVGDINEKILKAEGSVYLFGAHVFSQMLINLGLNTKKIRFILDNSKIKQGKRLYGTDLRVRAPEFLKGEEKPVVILRVGAYKEEIQKQIRKINKSTIFIE